jgi:hypothetical protein
MAGEDSLYRPVQVLPRSSENDARGGHTVEPGQPSGWPPLGASSGLFVVPVEARVRAATGASGGP